jgi:hypothetical protein
MAAIVFDTINPSAADPGTSGTPFLPLDPGAVCEAIPAFFIGRNQDGFWVARDARGRIGGLFLSESGALSFARRNSDSAGCATIYPATAFELDLENTGNPFITPLVLVKRFASRARQRIADATGR